MNHDLSASASPAGGDGDGSSSSSSSSSSRTTTTTSGNHVVQDDPPAPALVHERRQRNRLLFNRKREHYLKDFLTAIDVLVYAEMAAVYYLDCSFTRFSIRAAVHFVFLTPKPPFLPEPPENRPYIGAIFGSNLLCAFFHLYNSPPGASETTRNYLHGGLAMDFIGQKAPTSKLHLILLDFLIVLLQLVALGALLTRIKAKKHATLSPLPAVAPPQDLDHEERGLHASDHDPVDIELQTLNPSTGQDSSTSAPTPDQDESLESERDALLASTTQPPSDAHIFDAFNSGEIVILDLNLVRLVHMQMLEYQNPSPEGTTIQPSPSLSGTLSRRPLNFRLRIGNRILGV